MRINRNNGIMETSPCKDKKQGQGQGLDHKDQDKDKDLTHKDQDMDKDLTPKNQDKDLKNVLKESLKTSTRTRINIPDKLSFNLPKTNYFLFRTNKKQLPQNRLDVTIDKISMPQINASKLFGFHIDQHLEWSF